MYSEKIFKNFIKLLTSPFLEMLQTFFTQRTLQRHSKGTLRSLKGHSGTRARLAVKFAEVRNSRVTKSSFETELRKMTSQFELPT